MAKVKETETIGWGEKRSVFLALRDAIRRELETGRSLRAVHVASGADKAMGYSIFTRYVARYLPAESEIQRRGTSHAAPANRAPAPAPAAASAPIPEASGNPELSDRTPKENNDGPKIAPRPRGFVRRPGLPEDNKEYLIGPSEGPHDASTQGRRR